MYLPIETSGTKECGIEHIGTVRSGKDDHAAVRSETVHLRQELVQRALALVVTAGHDTFSTGTTDSIYLINEDDSRGFLFGLTEEIPHAACTDADEHLHEIRTAHREERYSGFAGNGFGKQSLTRSRRAYKKRALGDLRTDLRIFLGALEELHDLLHLLFGAIETCHVFESHFVLLLLVEELCLGFAHAEDTSSQTASHASSEIDEEEDHQRKRKDIDEYQIPVVMALDVRHVDNRFAIGFATGVHGVHVFGELLYGRHLSSQLSFRFLAVALRTEDHGIVLRTHGSRSLQVIRYFDLLNRSRIDIGGQLGITQLLARSIAFFVAKEVESQDGESSGIEQDTDPSPRTGRLPVLLFLRLHLGSCISFFCHFS